MGTGTGAGTRMGTGTMTDGAVLSQLAMSPLRLLPSVMALGTLQGCHKALGTPQGWPMTLTPKVPTMTLETPGDEPPLQEPSRALGTPRDPPHEFVPPAIGVPRHVTHWHRGRWPWSHSGSSEGTRGPPVRPWWPHRSHRWPRQSPAGGLSPGGRTPAPGASRGCARTLRGQRHGGTACGGDTTPRGTATRWHQPGR